MTDAICKTCAQTFDMRKRHDCPGLSAKPTNTPISGDDVERAVTDAGIAALECLDLEDDPPAHIVRQIYNAMHGATLTTSNAADQRGFWRELDHIANFINSLDSSEMSARDVRSAIYSECLTARPSNAAVEGEVERLRAALTTAESEARRYAACYRQGSDGRNTFVIFADMIAALSKGSGQ